MAMGCRQIRRFEPGEHEHVVRHPCSRPLGPIADGSWGWGLCDLTEVRFNSNKRSEITADLTTFRTLAAHEMGHAIGLDHVARYDSFGSDNPPLMGSCVLPWGGDYRLTQDDHAAMQLQTDRTGSAPWKSATANSSFEEDGGYMEFWGIKSGSETQRGSTGVDGTPYYMRFRHTSAEPYIFSTTSLINDPSIDWVKARANYKMYDPPTDTGTVKVVLRVAAYDVGGNRCGWQPRRDGTHSTGTYYYYQTSCSPGLDWAHCDTSGQNPPDKPAEDGGVEVRVYVYNRMYNALGNRTWVSVDRVRVLVDY